MFTPGVTIVLCHSTSPLNRGLANPRNHAISILYIDGFCKLCWYIDGICKLSPVCVADLILRLFPVVIVQVLGLAPLAGSGANSLSHHFTPHLAQMRQRISIQLLTWTPEPPELVEKSLLELGQLYAARLASGDLLKDIRDLILKERLACCLSLGRAWGLMASSYGIRPLWAHLYGRADRA